MSDPRHALLLLAAGQSRRLGQSKQLLRLDGETLVHRAARLGLATSPNAAFLIVAPGATSVVDAVADLPLRPLWCPEAGQGLGHSLRTGLAAVPATCCGALVLLCDQPGLDEAHLHALVAAWRRQPTQAAASRYAQVLGVPAILPRTWFAQLAQLEGDRGARELLRDNAAQVQAVTAPGLAQDVDTPAALAALGSLGKRE